MKLPYGKKYPGWLRDHIDNVMRLGERWFGFGPVGQLCLPVEMRFRCEFAPFGLQCVYATDEKFCGCHYQGLYWPHTTAKEYEQQERYSEDEG